MLSYFAAVAAFWAIWRLLRCFDLSLRARRFLFVCLGTLVTAPMLVPTSTITVGTMPNGPLVLDAIRTGGSYIDYLLHTAEFAFPSLGITACAFGLIAWRGIKADSGRIKPNWLRLTIPLGVLFVVLAAYGYAHPNWGIPGNLKHASVERVYGLHLREVAELLEISDSELLHKEIARLNEAFGSDVAVLGVSMWTADEHGIDYHYRRLERTRSSSCIRRALAEDTRRFWRCRWKWDGQNGRMDVLEYRRPYGLGKDKVTVTLDLEYDAALAVLIE